jgi:hypothetical protein
MVYRKRNQSRWIYVSGGGKEDMKSQDEVRIYTRKKISFLLVTL